MSSPTGTLQILLLTGIALAVSGVQNVTVAPDRGTAIKIGLSGQVKGCKMCTGTGRSRQCNTALELKGNSPPISVEFECSRPQDTYSVEIVRHIECDTKSCSGHIVQSDYGSLPLVEFERTFTWSLKASSRRAFKIQFGGAGLSQIHPSEKCPDGHSYTLKALQITGDVSVGKYCKTGLIRNAQIQNQGSFSLDVPAGKMLQKGQFDVSVGEEIKSLAKITLIFPKWSASSLELLSPNYPNSFPDDDVMEWYFEVPDSQKASINFLKHTQPHCLKKEAAVEYQTKWKQVLVRLGLSEQQPEQSKGSFSLTLRNCEMDRRRASAPGLSLNLKVSTSSKRSSGSCRADMSKMLGLSLHIEQVKGTGCQMKINSVPKEKITVATTSELTFQDCYPEDVQISASRVIECSQLKECPKAPMRLALPVAPPCLPAPLSSVTWTLRPREHGSVGLTSPSGPLKQSLPGQPCNDSMVIHVADGDGATVGHFCPKGTIQEVQIHNNVSVTVTGIGGEPLGMSPKHVLDARLLDEISERYIFRVSPKKDSGVLLATPGWPAGMKPYYIVSWIVNVPPKMEAHLEFANVSQPKCGNRHTNIQVQRVGRQEEDYSRREDEDADSLITVSGTFYLNMSNCMAESGQFSVITKITLEKSKNYLLTTILSVVATLVVIFVIVLAVVCVVIRKKKKKLEHQVSIYNPNGTSFLPGQSMFLPGQNGGPKDDDDNHEYASIEDTLVYTHLLRKGREIGVYGEFDTDAYQEFPGPTNSQKPLVSKSSSDNEAQVGAYQPFQYPSQPGPPLPVRPPSHPQSLVDNDIYQSEEEPFSPQSLSQRQEPDGED